MKKNLALLVIMATALSACGGSHMAPPNQPDKINGIAVPPDPGAAADATLLGVDVNGNGVRDEIDRRIAQDYGLNPSQYDGVMRAAKLDQSYLYINGEPGLSTAATIANGLAGACLYERFSGDAIAASKASKYSFSITVNTLARARAYQATSMASKEISHIVPKIACQ